ncbi:cytochrome C oxidase subunit IV family protein [Mycolicibacterium hippocampi]|uniref:Prokaryotic cytochrome C oxidase subunit IV family protein n=1 Tax=Mycolicibacterium hippocampi TaxID=659824 RepID=A0A7I9ZTD1_9MYCO|nr:cytochrome C oxidase subunit IV family protein [Mycolicibacterium hippocampi]GFH04275.1 prokaryotic cytochrome C oxidase subunit IV family protein [Mycolicibacterium hippocampi]
MTTSTDSPERSTRAITAAWLVLSAITVVSWWLAPGHSEDHASASVPITVTAILLGFIKGRVIIRYFMEVRDAPRWLRHSTDLWLAALWGAVLVIYLW